MRRPFHGILLPFLGLFSSLGTLVCCAVPSLLVLLGLGTAVTSVLSAAPWLVTLSRHKGWLFTGSALLLGGTFYYLYRLAPRLLVAAGLCPADDPGACATATRVSRVVLWVSTGLYLALWAKGRQPEATVTGLDGDPQILAIARKKAARVGHSVEFRLGLSDRLPFPDQAFDCVLSSLFFHHLELDQKIAALLEVQRVLRPGGALHIADWGKPTSGLTRGLFYVVQVLDGFSETRDHVAGRFPLLMKEAGFDRVAVRGTMTTMYGTLNLFYGRSAGTAHASP